MIWQGTSEETKELLRKAVERQQIDRFIEKTDGERFRKMVNEWAKKLAREVCQEADW